MVSTLTPAAFANAPLVNSSVIFLSFNISSVPYYGVKRFIQKSAHQKYELKLSLGNLADFPAHAYF
jgi:hypothetical protein